MEFDQELEIDDFVQRWGAAAVLIFYCICEEVEFVTGTIWIIYGSFVFLWLEVLWVHQLSTFTIILGVTVVMMSCLFLYQQAVVEAIDLMLNALTFSSLAAACLGVIWCVGSVSVDWVLYQAVGNTTLATALQERSVIENLKLAPQVMLLLLMGLTPVFFAHGYYVYCQKKKQPAAAAEEQNLNVEVTLIRLAQVCEALQYICLYFCNPCSYNYHVAE